MHCRLALGQLVLACLILLTTGALADPTRDEVMSGAARCAGIADNLALSSRRATTVAAFLQSQGINPNILSAKGFGATHPVAPNDTPQGRAQNRRIEIVLEGTGA